MTNERWQLAYTIYESAAQLAEPEWQQYVRTVAPDMEIAAKVLAMLDEMAIANESDALSEAASDSPRAVRASSSLPNGTELGRFVISSFVGQGGMGSVYSARDPDLNREVALKVIGQRGETSNPEGFFREAQAASALNHPNIVTVYEVIRSGSTAAIAMELVTGTSLRSLCGTAQPVGKVVFWGGQIARALAAAHAQGIVHRDIKPENLMLRPDGYIKVLDFGLARQAGAARVDDELAAGTLGYMSPEEVLQRPITAASDVFSLGIVLYELAGGTNPFRAESAGATTRLIQGLEAPPLPTGGRRVFPELDRLLRLMLSKSAADRPTATEVALRLEALAQPRTFRRRTIWLAAALALCVFGGIALSRVLPWRRVDSKDSSRAARAATNAVMRLEQYTTTGSANRITAASFSADGAALAWGERNGALVLRRLKSNATQTFQLPSDWDLETISWKSGGSKLLLSGYSPKSRRWDLRMLDVSSGSVSSLRADAKSGVFSPDGNAIAFTNSTSSSGWLSDANGRNARKVLEGDANSTFPILFWSSSRRLSYQRRRSASKSRRQAGLVEENQDSEHSYGSLDSDSAKVLTEARIPTTYSACALDDGRVLFVSRLPGQPLLSRSLWVARTNRETGAFTEPPRHVTDLPQFFITGISCSRDGREVGVTVQKTLYGMYVADLVQPFPSLANVRALTLDEKPVYPQSWSTDSNSVYFERGISAGKPSSPPWPASTATPRVSIAAWTGQEVEQWDIYRQSLLEKTPSPIASTPETEYYPILSSDPKQVLFQQFDEKLGRSAQHLMRISVEGGTAAAVPTGGSYDEFRCASSGAGCVIRIVENKQHVYYELDPFRGRGRELLRTPETAGMMGDWSLSSDGSMVAIPNHDLKTAAIRVIRLQPEAGAAPEWEVSVPGLANLRGIQWAASDVGWFASAFSPTGVALLYIDKKGRFLRLRDSPIVTWGVPSPNGRHLAFVDQEVQSNLWKLRGL